MCDEVRICPQCERPNKRFVRSGICFFCHVYYRRHGTYKRKMRLRATKYMGPQMCEACEVRKANSGWLGGKHLCNRCWTYYRRNGRHRPKSRNYIDPHGRCRNPNCRRPMNGARGNGGFHEANGYCHNCYQYQYNHGRARPAKLVNRQAPLGWCECGNPAVEVRQLVGAQNPSGSGEPETWDEPLCAECAALEDEPIY